MPSVQRDPDGGTVAVSLVRDELHCEEVDRGDADLCRFLQGMAAQPALAGSDLQLVRVLEDLIDVLVERSVIRFTDLPQAARDKLDMRRSVRASMRSLDLLGERDEPLF